MSIVKMLLRVAVCGNSQCLKTVNSFRKTYHLRCLTVVLNTHLEFALRKICKPSAKLAIECCSKKQTDCKSNKK